MSNELNPASSATWSARLPRMSPVRAFGTVFFAVYLFIMAGTALLTLMLPETFTATARASVKTPAALEYLYSSELLSKVASELNLAERYAAHYGDSKPLSTARVTDILRRSIRVSRIRGTDLVEISVSGRSPSDCADLANVIAATAAKHASSTRDIQVIDKAQPPPRPSRPNKVLNLALGTIVGIFLGTMAGGVGAKLAVGFDGR